MARLRGTKAGQRGIAYLLTPAIYILSYRKDDKDLDKSVGFLRFYVEDPDRGRMWRNQAGYATTKFTAPDGIQYETVMETYPNEDALRECVGVIIDRIFGVDYKTVPRFDIAPPPGMPFPHGYGPMPHSMHPGFPPHPGFPGGLPFNLPGGRLPQAPRGYGYGPSSQAAPPRAFPINTNAPFNEMIPPETREGLAKAWGLTLRGMVDSWTDIEKDFNLPNIPYYW